MRFEKKKELLRLIKKRELNLSFLRTCRLVHNEASEVFYGENEFLFTAINGHMVANLFIRKIYKQHFQYINELKIPMPLYISSDYHPWRSNTHRYNNIVPQLLATNWEDKNFDYVQAWKHLAWNMMRMDCLRKLTLVLPEYHYWFNYSGKDMESLDEIRSPVAAKPRMELVIVRLRARRYGDDDADDDDVLPETEWWANQPCQHRIVTRKIKSMVSGCTVKAAAERQPGCWQIMDDVPESVLLPEVEHSDSETDNRN